MAKYNLTFFGKEYMISAGDSYSISADTEHSLEIVEADLIIDVFIPIHQDYL